MRTTTLENLEDHYDAIVAEKAYEEHLVDPVIVSHDALMKDCVLIGIKPRYSMISGF